MEGHVVTRIMDRVRANWSLANHFEATLEANPTSVEAERFAVFRLAGIDRVSLGVQALDDGDLRKLGRLHSVSEALRAIEIAQTTFDRVSFDLIYARQDQSVESWQDELSRALAVGTDHLSLYQLTVEPGTAFGDRFDAGKLAGLPSDDRSADMFQLTQELTSAHGLPAYEISNHARKDQESRHNLIYWRGGDYLGIGPGAHGRLTMDGKRYATETALNPGRWLQLVENSGAGETNRELISRDERDTEYLMMALRTDEGANLEWISQSEKFNLVNKINSLKNFLEYENDALRVKPECRIILNAILKELLT